jgi:hypothetical protein
MNREFFVQLAPRVAVSERAVMAWGRLKMHRVAKLHRQINLLAEMLQIKDAPLYAFPFRANLAKALKL